MAALNDYLCCVPEKFPKLRIAALEAAVGGFHFHGPADEEFENAGAREAPLLKESPAIT